MTAADMLRVVVASCLPFGDAASASIWVIGHDPRLRRSAAEAGTCFFLDRLAQPPGGSRAERRKRDLAQAVWDYIQRLAGAPIPLSDLYVTNLCNHFLNPPPGSGTVLIPDDLAEQGLLAIRTALGTRRGPPLLILSMSQQVLWHMVRTSFVEDHPALREFSTRSRPQPGKAAIGRYAPEKQRGFVDVCGKRFKAQGVPIVPILHIKSIDKYETSYSEALRTAQFNIRAIINQHKQPDGNQE